ncbi:ankryin [Wolbachia endosymbiont of Delia radicum]|uniref:ankryin n=1 Tax=unclassified Wolbachia TaxID=2640676 RepID=UPI001F2E070F|nr:ankryin [Wolbachia endosymbiont of Delia radicum]UJQ20714.1 ankryin [Wolbachia endosymbiont of Delia radicum]
MNIEAIQQKPPRTFEYKSKNTSYDALPSKEPIYAEVYDTKVSNSLGENGYLSVSEESIYAEIYDSHKKSTENLSLEDSGYLSISEEPIYCTIDDLSEQKKPTSLKQKEPEQSSEPIYARVDLSKKRAERKAKDIKANSGTCHGLVQDKVNDWQVKLNELSANKSISQQQTNDQKIKTKAGFSVEEIRQKYERRDSGYDSGYDSDTKVEQQLELAPKSEIGSVSIEHGVIGGCRYKITDISL